MTLYPTYAKPVSLEVITRTRNFAEMHPTMRERLQALLVASGGKVGWGQGMRSAQLQLQLFLDRHSPDPNGKITWDNRRWTRVKGAPAAPPGKSMHEIGLAADLVGDFAWLGTNAARFGLVTFVDVNNEPWHVQPKELPNGRSQYTKQGSVWGEPGNYRAVGSTGTTPAADTAIAADTASGTSGTTPQVATPGTTPTLTPALVAKPGDTGPAARVLIEALVARSLLPDAPATRDGTYGDDDVALVRSFQEAQGLKVDGIVGPQSWSKLLAPVQPGETSPMVRVLQTTLIVRSLIRDSAANLDGVYGTATQARVKDFQSVSGIDPIAVAGPATWTALLGVAKPVTLGGDGDEEEEIDLDDLDFLAALDGLSAE